MINYLYDILFLIPDDILEFLPPFCMLFLFAIFAGLRPRHIINFIKDPPIVPYIGFGQVKLWFTGVFIPILIIFIIIILTSIFSIVEQIQTNDWVEVDATVENAEERGETTCDGEGGCTTSYDTHVLYSYNYKNTEYYGYEYTYISDDFPGLEEDYPEGLEITVYVDPNNPSDSLMVKGWEGVWIEIVKMISILGFIFIALSSFLFVWRVAYQLQSAENKKIANEKPGKSGLWNAGLMNDVREIISFTKLMKKANEDVYEGEVKTLKFMIDGEEINKEVRKLNDIFEVMMEMDRNSILYLDDNGKMGRNIEFDLDTSGDDDMMEVKELLAGELIREETINLDDDPLKAAEFISSALEASASDGDKQWWNY